MEKHTVRLHHVELDRELGLFTYPVSIVDDHPISFLHRHQCTEIGVCLSGSGVFAVDGKLMEFAAGDVTIITGAEAHLARSEPGAISQWRWIYFDPERVALAESDAHLLDPRAFAGPSFRNVIRSDESPTLRPLALRMASELDERPAGFRSTLPALTAQFVIETRRVRPAPDDRGERGMLSEEFERIAPAVALIATHFMENLTIRDLSEECRVSEPTLRRLFAAAMGCSPKAYLVDLRLQMSAAMLQSTSDSVLAVSRAVGFSTLSNFNRLFLARFGEPPREWRRRRSAETESATLAGVAP